MLRVSDLVSGLVVAAMGLAIFLRAQSFPSVGGVAIAPSFYPGLIGAVLTILCYSSLAMVLFCGALALMLRPLVARLWTRRARRVAPAGEGA